LRRRSILEISSGNKEERGALVVLDVRPLQGAQFAAPHAGRCIGVI
jgi:hypothetical protein